jgi:hypothetical protein
VGEVVLVIADLERGRTTLEFLDRKKFPVDAAWWYLEDDDEWQFYLHTPLIDEYSRKQVYEKLRDELADDPEVLQLREITLLSSSSELLLTLRSSGFKIGYPGDTFEVQPGPGLKSTAAIRLAGNTIDGVFIRDVLIYRL